MSDLSKIKKELNSLGNPRQAKILQRFFKTGKGEYGEGDVFLGIKVGPQRTMAKKYATVISISETEKLLHSKIHEHRLVALLILIQKYKKADDAEKKRIFDFYLANTAHINNWDLVDLSAANIVGDYLTDRHKDRAVLYELAGSGSLWERRISIISTHAFIKNNNFGDTLKISEMLLHDKHDLIHKAVGWMLREVGKRDQPAEEKFLKRHYKTMPRTMLRYAIERFNDKKRKFYMKK